MDSVPEGITIADTDLRIRMVSRFGQDLLGGPHAGMTTGEVIGRWETFREDGVTPMPEAEHPLTRAVRSDEIVRDAEVVQVNEAGRALHLLCNAAPIRDADGTVTGGVVAWQDVTDQRRAGEALSESEARYRELFESMVEGFALHEIVLDAAGNPVDYRFLAANPAFEAMTGLSAGDIVGRTALEVLPGLEPGWIERYGRVATTGEPERFLSYSSPLERWYDVHAYSPGPGRFATVFTDVTGERRALGALGESEERYRSLFENSIDAIFLTRPDGTIVAANPEACRTFGMTEEEVIERGRPAARRPDGSRARGCPGGAGPNRAVSAGRSPVPAGRRDRLHRRDRVGGLHTARTRSPTRRSTRVRDVTDRTMAEEALRTYAENLQRSNEDLERFAYVSSHDLQEPLRAIVSFSQLLERRYKGQLDEDADDYIDFIVEGGIRMQTLIQDLLAYSRVNTTKQDLRPTDMEDVMAAVERNLDLQLREAGAVITHDPVPMVLADPLQLEQVVANLVSNAIKFRRDGRAAPDPRRRTPDERLLGVLGERQRDRDRARVPRQDLRDLPAAPHEGRVPRHGDRPRDREADHRPPRRHDPGRVDAGRGLDLLLHPSGRVEPGAPMATASTSPSAANSGGGSGPTGSFTSTSRSRTASAWPRSATAATPRSSST